MPTYDPTKPFDIRTNPNAPVAQDYVSSAQPGVKRTIVEGNQYHPGTTPSADPAEEFLSTFRAPETAGQIAERKRQQSQGLIDSINKNFDDEIARKKVVGQERVNMDNAISVLTGNMGGTEAVGSRGKVLDANEKELQAVNNQRSMALAQVYTKISGDADAEAREQLQDATRSAEQVIARRKESQTQAVDSLKLIAASGLVDFDAFQTSPQNSKVYKYALDSVGGDENALKGLFMLNRPKEQLVGAPQRIGNKYVQAYQNPQTGKIKYEQLDMPFDLPTEYNTFQTMGDNLVAIPDNWDGDISKLKTVYTATPKAVKRDTQVVQTADGRQILIDSQTGEEIKSIGGDAATGGKQYGYGFTDASKGKLTVDEAKARQFAVNAKIANGALSDSGYSPGLVEMWKPNAVKSSARQKFEQSARQFVNAVLRRESGATITDPEFINKYAELIPEGGDRAGVIEQKKAARDAAILTIAEAGRLQLGSASAGTEGETYELNGVTYTQGPDGMYYPQQ
jgi:hypothetical protein